MNCLTNWLTDLLLSILPLLSTLHLGQSALWLVCLASRPRPNPYRCFIFSLALQCQSFFFSVFLLLLLSAQSGRSLKEARLSLRQTRSYLVDLLFSLLPPFVHLYTPGKCRSCFWHVTFVLLTGFISLHQVKVCQDNAAGFLIYNYRGNLMIRMNYS